MSLKTTVDESPDTSFLNPTSSNENEAPARGNTLLKISADSSTNISNVLKDAVQHRRNAKPSILLEV